jgi:hypothetical protein
MQAQFNRVCGELLILLENQQFATHTIISDLADTLAKRIAIGLRKTQAF